MFVIVFAAPGGSTLIQHDQHANDAAWTSAGFHPSQGEFALANSSIDMTETVGNPPQTYGTVWLFNGVDQHDFFINTISHRELLVLLIKKIGV